MVFLGKGLLKICRKFTREDPCQSAISIKLENMQQIYSRTPCRNAIQIKLQSKIALRHGCSPVNVLHIFRTASPKNTSGQLLLKKAVKELSFYYICRIETCNFCSNKLSHRYSLTVDFA